MSTAGKVLVVLIMLASLIWMILTAGVTQLNRNGNQAVIDLTNKVVKLQEDVKTTQDEIVNVKNQTTLLQEQMDRELGVIEARQSDIQRVSSNVREILYRVQYELATVQQTVQEAEEDRTHRAEEKAAEVKALAAAREEVVALKAKDRELTEHLGTLRNQFTSARNANLDLLGKAVK
jgi:chromosome segregation ATPase